MVIAITVEIYFFLHFANLFICIINTLICVLTGSVLLNLSCKGFGCVGF